MSRQLCERALCTNQAQAFVDDEFLCELHAPVDAEVYR